MWSLFEMKTPASGPKLHIRVADDSIAPNDPRKETRINNLLYITSHNVSSQCPDHFQLGDKTEFSRQ